MQCCDKFVVTFEIFEPAWGNERRYHRDNPVCLVKGTTVGVEDMLKESEMAVDDKYEHYRLYTNVTRS